MRNTATGTPQGGILSPLVANVALSVLDEHFAEAWQSNSGSTCQRTKRRRAGLPNFRIVRYADDFVVLVALLRQINRCCVAGAPTSVMACPPRPAGQPVGAGRRT